MQTWLKEAQARTEEYHRNGPRSPVTWILVHGTQIPQYAIQGGDENGQPLFISRAFHEVSISCLLPAVAVSLDALYLPTYLNTQGSVRASSRAIICRSSTR